MGSNNEYEHQSNNIRNRWLLIEYPSGIKWYTTEKNYKEFLQVAEELNKFEREYWYGKQV